MPIGVVQADLQTNQNFKQSRVASTSTTEAAYSQSQKPHPTWEEVVSSFEGLKDEIDNVDELISFICQVLEKKSKQEDNSDKNKARSREPLTVGAVEADLQTKQNPLQSPGASTSMAQTSTTEAAYSESQKPPSTFGEVINSFEGLKDEINKDDELISVICQVLEKKSKQADKSDKDKTTRSSSFEAISTTKWSECVKSGIKFLEFFGGHFEKMEKESGFSRKVVRAYPW